MGNSSLKTALITREKEEVLHQTYSFCPICKKIIPASIIKDNGKVFLKKKCENQEFKVLLENDLSFYQENSKHYYEEEPDLERMFVPIDEIEEIEDRITGLNLYLTGKCNLDCPVCFSSVRGEMGLESIRKLLEVENKWIILTGGEPTLREDLPEIIEMVKESGNIPMLQTNGVKLTNRDYAKKLKEKGLKYVQLSFNGFNEEVYEEIYGSKSLLKVKLKALENLEELGFRVSLSMTVKKGMEEPIRETLDYALEHDFVKEVVIRPASPSYKGIKNGIEFSTTQSDIAEMLGKITNDKVNKETLLGIKKLRWNFYKLFGRHLGRKAGEFYPEVSLNASLTPRGELLFRKEVVESLNREMRGIREGGVLDKIKNLFKLGRDVLFNKGVRRLATEFLVNGLNLQKVADNFIYEEDLVRIKVDKVYTLLLRDLNRDIKVYSAGGEDVRGVWMVYPSV